MRRTSWWAAGTVVAGTALAGFGALGGAPVAVGAWGFADIAWSDERDHRIPNRTLLATTAALAATAVLATLTGDESGRGGLLSGGLWFATLVVVHLFDRRLGFGDVKLAGPLGFMLGWAVTASGQSLEGTAVASGLVFVAGCGVALGAARRAVERPTPMGPGLVGAAFVAALTASVLALAS